MLAREAESPFVVRFIPTSTGSKLGTWINYKSDGFGEGSLLRADRIARSELEERLHFRFDLPVHRVGDLSSLANDGVTADLQLAFSQLSTSSRDDLNRHQFQLTRCVDLYDCRYVYLPTCVISSDPTDCLDRSYIPVRDTVGCSSHFSITDSIKTALCEFLERQSLFAMWVSDGNPLQFSVLELGKNDQCIRGFVNRSGSLLYDNFDVIICDFLGIGFTVLCSCSSSGRFHFGSRFSWSFDLAFEGAISELRSSMRWSKGCASSHQSVRLFLDKVERFRNNSKTHRHLENTRQIDANNQGTASGFTTEAVARLHDRRIRTIAYLASRKEEYSQRYFCRIVSPGMFLARCIPRCVNYDNLFSRITNLTFTKSYVAEPF